jgi:hypothetical protein
MIAGFIVSDLTGRVLVFRAFIVGWCTLFSGVSLRLAVYRVGAAAGTAAVCFDGMYCSGNSCVAAAVCFDGRIVAV